jgi:mono/diheme cytochrome c family protein
MTQWLSVALCTIAAGSLVASLSCSTQQAEPPAAAAAAVDPVARGEYMVTVMGCNDCHTPGYLYGAPDMNRMLSGSEIGWPGPWGLAFAANLTPDAETGLGNWSDDDIVTALRTGQRPDGRVLAPIMPYSNFATLTDEDVRAIVAYLRSIPPVVHQEPGPVPPGEQYAGAMLVMPPPPAWDVPPPTE